MLSAITASCGGIPRHARWKVCCPLSSHSFHRLQYFLSAAAFLLLSSFELHTVTSVFVLLPRSHCASSRGRAQQSEMKNTNRRRPKLKTPVSGERARCIRLARLGIYRDFAFRAPERAQFMLGICLLNSHFLFTPVCSDSSYTSLSTT